MAECPRMPARIRDEPGMEMIKLSPLTLPLSPENGGEGGGEGEMSKREFLYN